MRVLVTGANGFVGTRLCRHLQAAGHNVRAHLRRPLLDFAVADQVLVDDLGETSKWRAALEGVEAVVHLAGRAHILKETTSDPLADFRRVNVAGTRTLALAAAGAGVVRFVFVSSIKANGEESSRAGFSEQDTPAPGTPYGLSKLEAEEALWEIGKATGMQVVVVRPPLVYGAKGNGNFPLLQKLVQRRVPMPFGSVQNLRTLIGVDNLADFLVRCVTHPSAAGEFFLIGDSESVSTRELVTLMGRAINRPPILLPFPAGLATRLAGLAGRPEMARALFGTLVVDSAKARALLEWSPPDTLAEGLARSFQE